MSERIRDDVDRFVFTDEPVRYPPEDYRDVMDAYVSSVAELREVKAIYQMGSIGVPGISDLDLIVVLKDGTVGQDAKSFGTRRFGPKAEYIFMHPGGMVTNETTFKRLPLLIYASDLRRLTGEEIGQMSLDRQTETYVAQSIAIDHSVHLLHQLVKFAVGRVINTRRCVMSLASLKYSIKLAARGGVHVRENWALYQNKIEQMRVNWFKGWTKEALLASLEEGISILNELMVDLEGALTDQRIIEADPAKVCRSKVIFPSYGSAIVFVPWNQSDSTKGSLAPSPRKVIRLSGRYYNFSLSVIRLPVLLFHHFYSYASGSSWLANGIKSLLEENNTVEDAVKVESSYVETMRQRVDLWAENLDFLASNNLSRYSVMPFFGVNRATLEGRWDRRPASLVMRLLLTYNKQRFKRRLWSETVERQIVR